MRDYYIIIAIFLITIGSLCYITDKLVETKISSSIIISEQKLIITNLLERLNRNQKVTITFYHPPSGGINSDSDHNKTATMTMPVVGRTIAISDELFENGWLGAKIYIEGYGVFVAEDRMSKTIKGKCIDIVVKSKKEAINLGKVYNINAVLL